MSLSPFFEKRNLKKKIRRGKSILLTTGYICSMNEFNPRSVCALNCCILQILVPHVILKRHEVPSGLDILQKNN